MKYLKYNKGNLGIKQFGIDITIYLLGFVWWARYTCSFLWKEYEWTLGRLYILSWKQEVKNRIYNYIIMVK